MEQAHTEIDNIKIFYPLDMTTEELYTYVKQEIAIWADKGKELGKITLDIDGDEVVIKSEAKSNIKRLRRITGYLSNENNFNDAKRAELKARQVHVHNR